MNAQITFNKIPLDKQLVARDPSTNKGEIIIEGQVDKSGSNPNYDSFRIEIYRTDNTATTLYKIENQPLSYSGSLASFNFIISIDAELANYLIRAFGLISSSSTQITLPAGTGNEIVAGDVYIIEGQSNAEANIKDPSDSAVANESEFIRVFASGTLDPVKLIDNQTWNYGKGDVSQGTPGNTGQWGIKLARLILDTQQIPVAIFNGANANRPISYFQAPADYQSSLESNYGRLYYRLDQTGLKESVRAVLWSQGEASVGISTMDYKNEFLSLKSSWENDYPNIVKFYIFQTKTHGLGPSVEEQMDTKEAQRQLADENSDIHIMTTEALASSDEPEHAHFVFTNGYEAFASRVYPLVKRDFYSGNNDVDMEPPMIIDAYLTDNTTLVVETDASSLIKDASIINGFQLNNAGSAVISNIDVNNNKIIFTLSQYPGASGQISYLGLDSGTVNGNFIRNTKNLELVCFNKYPITDVVLGVDDIEKSNYLNITHGDHSIGIQTSKTVIEVKVYDILGKLLYHDTPNKKSFDLKIDKVKHGAILIVETKLENNVVLNKKTIKY